MLKPPASHLPALAEGWRLLRRHPGQAAVLAFLGMLLGQLGPLLELVAGAGPSLLFQPLFAFVGMLPLEMFFLPRLQAQLDAELLDLPANPARDWHAAFDQRWLRSFLVRLGLSLVVAVGLLVFLVPGIVLLTLFGWTPLRILLRGEDARTALRWSQAAMARNWPKVAQAVLAMMLVALLFQLGAGWVMDHLLPAADPDLGPGALVRLRHPAFWVFSLLGGALNLWLTCALLALYHRLERAVPARS